MSEEEEIKEGADLNIDEAFEEAPVVEDAVVDMSAEFNDDEEIEADFVTDEERDGMY
jgi:succinate dehydrogenase/fumarate reductase-like Fe-S protein